MTPAPGRCHQEVVGEIFRQIADALEDHPCRVYVAPFDMHLPRANEADESVVYGRPWITELKGGLRSAVLSQVVIRWRECCAE